MEAERLFDASVYTLRDAIADQRDDRIHVSAIGASSEHLAVAKLLSLGHKVAIPVVDDDGVDLVVNYRLAVQVKSRQEPINGTSYVFNFNRSRGRGPRPLSAADVWICHGVKDDAWWVLPTAWIMEAGGGNGSLSLSLVVQRQSKNAELSGVCREAWHLLDKELRPPSG